MTKKETEHHLGNGDFINIKASQIVKLKDTLSYTTQEGPVVHLTFEITADFADINEEHHEVFFNMLSSKFMNKVSFGDNPFSRCQPKVKRKLKKELLKDEYF